MFQALGWDDPLEKGMATHSSILAWRIPWTEEPGGLQSMGSQRVRRDLATKTTTASKQHTQPMNVYQLGLLNLQVTILAHTNLKTKARSFSFAQQGS